MATSATIAILNKDETVTSVYLHWDGYPEHALEVLSKHYTEEVGIRELISLGDISSLGIDLDSTAFFGRDTGETGVDAAKHSCISEWLGEHGQDYNYLFKDGKWFEV